MVTYAYDFSGLVMENEVSEQMDNITFLQCWMRAKNPMLGNLSPLQLMYMGKGHRVAQFIDAAHLAELAPIEQSPAPGLLGDPKP